MKKIWLALLLSIGLSACVFIAVSMRENKFQMDADGYMPELPAGPTGGGRNIVYRDTMIFTPQEVFSNRVLETGEILRRNLLLAADEYRSSSVFESGETRVFFR